MGIISKTLKGFAGQVEAEPAPPPPAYTPLATNSVDQPSQQDSAHSMPPQAEYMYQNYTQPVQYQNQAPCPPQQGNAQYTSPTNYQTKYQNIANRYRDKYENQYHSGKYQKYEDQYQNGQYQKYQDQYESGKYQKYQDQYQNGQYQRHQQKYQNYPYQQHIPQQSQYYPPPQPPLQAPPMQGLNPCVIPRKSTVPSMHIHVPQFSTNPHYPRTERTNVLGGSYTSPFVRAHVPELECQTAISPPELLAFIDGLNEAFVPLGALATTDGSIARTKSYMRMANATIFKPKDLRVQINGRHILVQIGRLLN
ncbi:hypothetical protein N7466_002611 [Penicillium verhagenii]|uniref:uncharacterized protein n=1 Tax=Penicillium verhagenii TaxID=1562060 RepID=UPI002544F583|nr:uncharacterized protein N7466_002611 [Penicillium verhagenii]KAJ5939477.1 hypothetical protein N7466_002611 [Penicillium verhagenii]